jgi:hypothetical protein
MGKYGVGKNGYPSGRTGAADRNYYVQSGRAAKAARESSASRSSNNTKNKSSSTQSSSSSKGFFASLFGW